MTDVKRPDDYHLASMLTSLMSALEEVADAVAPDQLTDDYYARMIRRAARSMMTEEQAQAIIDWTHATMDAHDG